MPLQGFGIAPAGTHLLQIGRHGLLKRGQGKMTGLVLPGGATRRAGRWDVHEPSLRGGLVSNRGSFFKEGRIVWRVRPVQDLLAARKPLVVICPLSFFLGSKPRDGCTGGQGKVELWPDRPVASHRGRQMGNTPQGVS